MMGAGPPQQGPPQQGPPPPQQGQGNPRDQIMAQIVAVLDKMPPEMLVKLLQVIQQMTSQGPPPGPGGPLGALAGR